jgi:Tfp pilus assembly protein PilF
MSSDAHYRLASVAVYANDWETAFPLLERAVELAPRNVRAQNNLGVGYLRAGHYDRAEQALSRAVEANPAHFRAWLNLGLARHARGDARGCAAIARALALNPHYPAARAAWTERACR